MKLNRLSSVLLLTVLAAAGAKAQDAHFSHFTYTGNDQRFEKNYDPSRQFLNPILGGYYPDPSICRVGDTYYMVNSTFSFFPGVPIFESHDLLKWTQIGNVLDRPSQLPLGDQGVSGGIFAPDIKYNPHNKTFYMVTTNVGIGNFFVKTTDPHKGWSDPIRLPKVQGIDPSFFFDKDGTAYIVHNAAVEGGPDYEGQTAIRILRFDTRGDSIIGDYSQIVRGGTHVEAKPVWIEGPHLYRIGKYYYLMCAEGGTGDWHSEVIFRAPLKADITKAESWEECPNNPILTQRVGLPADRPDVVTSTGHADLVQAADGSWWAVFLGCRPYDGPFYNTGRDTYMLPVTWRDGWPQILPPATPVPTVVDVPQNPKLNAKNSKLSIQPSTPDPQRSTFSGNFTYTDHFDSPELNPRWIFLRNPEMQRYDWSGQGLTIHPTSADISQRKPLSALFFRQHHTDFTAETSLTFAPRSDKDVAGLALLQNEQYNFVLGKTLLDGRPAVTLTRTEREKLLVASAFISADAPLRLRVEGHGRYYTFCYAQGTDDTWHTLAAGVDAINLSTSRSGGFIGTCIGLYASAGE